MPRTGAAGGGSPEGQTLAVYGNGAIFSEDQFPYIYYL